MITDYHASYYAHELSRVGGTGGDRLGRALFDACVDLNPHQIEAALFALRSGMLPVTWWEAKGYSATEYGTNLLKNMFGSIADFSFPKSIHLVEDCLRALCRSQESLVLDFFWWFRNYGACCY